MIIGCLFLMFAVIGIWTTIYKMLKGIPVKDEIIIKISLGFAVSGILILISPILILVFLFGVVMFYLPKISIKRYCNEFKKDLEKPIDKMNQKERRGIMFYLFNTYFVNRKTLECESILTVAKTEAVAVNKCFKNLKIADVDLDNLSYKTERILEFDKEENQLKDALEVIVKELQKVKE